MGRIQKELEDIENKLDNLILQSCYNRNRRKSIGSEYNEFMGYMKKILSYKMFSKKELEIIDWYLQEYGTQEGVDKEADKLRKKVSKLLKEKQ